jgi:hypothetical protein
VILTGTEFENGSQGGRGVNGLANIPGFDGLARSHGGKARFKIPNAQAIGQQVSFEGQGPTEDHESKVRILEGHTGENIKNG